MKIDGQSSMQCEAEVPEPVKLPPQVCPNRVEQARAEERAYAGELSEPAKRLCGILKQVPTPGVLELELQGKVLHNGGKATVTAQRDESGDYVIRLAGEANVAVPFPVSVGINPGAATTFRVRTPEAAADLLQALVLSGAPGLAQGELGRTAHYAAQSLERLEVSLKMDAGADFAPAVIRSAAQTSTGGVAYVDFNKHLLVTETALEGEALSRGSMIAVRAGMKGQVAMKLRTETRLPDEMLARLASGELSPAQAMNGIEATRKIIFESEVRGEVHTLFAPGSEGVKKFEAEMNLDELFSHPLDPGGALKGQVKTMVAHHQAAGVGFDALGSGFLVRGAIFSVTEQPLFQAHDEGALQKELDVQRSVPR